MVQKWYGDSMVPETAKRLAFDGPRKSPFKVFKVVATKDSMWAQRIFWGFQWKLGGFSGENVRDFKSGIYGF